MVRFFLVALAGALFLSPGSAGAQSMYGLDLGNYSGVNSAILNPSALHNSRAYLDVHLIGMDNFLENNYLYLQRSDYRFSNFFKSGYEWPTHSVDYTFEQRIFYQKDDKRLKKAFVQARVLGPGAMVIFGRHAFGLTTGARSLVSLRNVPYELANFSYLGLKYPPQQNINYHDRIPVRAAQLAWAEIGLTYAYEVYARGFNHVSAGISVKRLMGVTGTYLYTTDLNYIVPDDSTIIVKNMDADIGMSLPVNYSTNQPDFSSLFKGGGFGIDIGFTYKRLKQYHQETYYQSLCARPWEDYLYRVGLALIDFGGVRFNRNAVKMKIDNQSSVWNNVNEMNFTNINGFVDTLSYQFYGDEQSIRTGETFTQWLPAAVSAQFDYHLDKYWFVNASLIQGFPVGKSGMVRPSELSVTPRFETSLFEVNLPVSLYDWTKPRVGLSMRIYGVTVGTDNLAGFLNITDFTGMDAYFSVRFFLNKGNCRLKGPVHCGTDQPGNYRR